MLRFIVSAVLLAAAPLVVAQAMATAVGGPQVELAADATREVPNDLMTATLFVEANDANPAALASLLNRATADALRTAGEFKAVQARTSGNQTYPVYDRANRQTGWRGRAEVRLESRDFQAMAQLVARLQSSMQLGGVAFAVSPELKRRTEDELINEAVDAFRARADIAAKALGSPQYRIRRMAINAPGGMPGPRPMARMSAASADVAAAPPVFEGGTSYVRVDVQGTVELP